MVHFFENGPFFENLFFLHRIVLFRIFSSRFETSGSMIPRLVPEILPCDGFCDGQGAAAGAGIGYSRS